MPKPKDPKRKAPTVPRSKKLPRDLPEDPVARGVAIMRETAIMKLIDELEGQV